MNFFAQNCILCLVHNNNIQSILLQDENGVAIDEKLKYIFSDFINYTPEIPKNICTDCLTDLNFVYNFKLKFSKNLRFLSDCMQEITPENEECNVSGSISTDTQHKLTPNYNNITNAADCNTAQRDEILETSNQQIQNNCGNCEAVLEPEEEHIDDDTDSSLLANDLQPIIPEEVVVKCEFEDNTNEHVPPRAEEPALNNDDELDEELVNIHDEIDIKHESLLSEDSWSEVDIKDIIKNETIEQENNINEKVVLKPIPDVSDADKQCSSLLLDNINTDKAADVSWTMKNQPSCADRGKDISTCTTGSNKKLYKCDVCEKAFAQNQYLKVHKRKHTGERPYKCDVCEKTFYDISTFNMHKRIHTGEQRYQCGVCDKAFYRYSKLSIHKHTHFQEKAHKCDMCDKAYYLKDHLLRHKIVHTRETPYACDLCDKTFYSKYYLIRHKRTHNGKEPYHCEICDKTFYNKCDSVKHIRSHSSEKLHECDVCGKTYSRQDSLTRHKLIHSDEKPYECNSCTYKCRTSYHLKLHIRRKHENK